MAGCSGAGGDRLAEAGLAEVKAAAGVTRKGTAAVRIAEQVSPGASGEDVITGRWDFDRRRGTFVSAGTTVVAAYGAEFRELSAAERAAQTGDPPAYRHGWTQRPVPTTDDVTDSDYFGLALESVATFADAYAVLDRATAARDVGKVHVGGTPTRHLRVTVPFTEPGAQPPEVWLDGDGRARRIRLSMVDKTVRITLVVELSDLGSGVEARLPPVDQLDPSAGIVPVAPWKVVRTGEEAGVRWRARVARDNRTTTNPPATGQCLAIEAAPFAPLAAPPVWYECHAPHPSSVEVSRVLPPDLRGKVVAGTAGPPVGVVPVAFGDGTSASAPVTDGIFVQFTGGRKVATVAGEKP